jgi:hypothetical protein
MPTPSSPCEVSSLPDGEYPDLPQELSNATVKTFVETFEKQYAKASIQEERNSDFSGFDGWRSVIREIKNEGYIVSVHVGIDYSTNPTDQYTSTVPASKPFDAVYYVTRTFAMRTDGKWSESIPESGWETVACESG